MNSSSLVSKLAIGSVQFGLNYGISNLSGKTDNNEVEKILEVADGAGIDTIDTALDYGSSEESLGKFNLNNWNIVSKFSEAADGIALRTCISKSLSNLKQESLYGYIAHDSSIFIKQPELWDTMLLLKSEGLVKKIGYSLYSPDVLKQLLELGFIPDLVQVPFNILDNRFESYFPTLKNHGTEIHTRSAFLQGIFFMNPEKLGSYFEEIIPFLKELNSEFENPESKAGYLLNHCIKNSYISKVVIGVNTHQQLISNIKSLTSDESQSDFKINYKISEKILLPSNWPQN